MRAAVDVMGGDKAPAAILKGCWEAAGLLEAGDTILLVVEQEGRGACHTGEHSCFFRAFGAEEAASPGA